MIIQELTKKINYSEAEYIVETLSRKGMRGFDPDSRFEKLAKIMVGENSLVSTKISIDQNVTFWGTCSRAEVYHQAVLFRSAQHNPYGPLDFSNHYRRGMFISIDNIILGYIKLVRNPTFLATKTVQKNDGTYPLIKGALYCVDETIYSNIVHEEIKNSWKIKCLDELKVKPRRYGMLNQKIMRKYVNKEKVLDFNQRLEWVVMLAQRALDEEIVREKHFFEILP